MHQHNILIAAIVSFSFCFSTATFGQSTTVESANIPLNGNYIVAESGSCSPGLPNSGNNFAVAWLATNNFVSQGAFIPEASSKYSVWLSNNNLGSTQTKPGSDEIPTQWGRLNRLVMYGASSAVGQFSGSNLPPFPPPKLDDPSKLNGYFIVTRKSNEYFLYIYNQILGDFFKYGAVFSQANAQSSSVAGASNGSVNGCTFLITLHQ